MSESINAAVQLSKKAVTSFVLGLLSLVTCVITGVPAIILGIWALVDISKSQGRLEGKGFAIAGIAVPGVTMVLGVPLMVALLLPAISAAREAARASVSANNMRQIGLAMLNYEDQRRRLPAAGVTGERANLSWRVHILPYLEHAALYKEFHLDEPWDSEHNKALIDRMPAVYATPGREPGAGKTMYLVPTGNGALFQGEPNGPLAAQVSDGRSNTIMLVEVDPEAAKIWTQPEDWEFDPLNPKRGLGGHRFGGSCLIQFADGAVLRIRLDDVDPAKLSAAFTRAGGEAIGPLD